MLNKGLEVQLDKLIDSMDNVMIRQDLCFLLNFAFVNKVNFLLHGISVFAYVDLFFTPKKGPQESS